LAVTQKRNQRALKAIGVLKARQQKQAKQIDVLCRDMVSAHELFSLTLARLTFATSFYESLLGCGEVEEAIDRTLRLIGQNIDQAGAAIFLVEASDFEVHLATSADGGQVEKANFKTWFNRDIVHQISQTNHICTLNDMLKMGLMAPPSSLKTLSAAAVPLGRLGLGVGFILVYRSAEHPLLAEELSRVAAIAPGLREALCALKAAPVKSSLTPSAKP